MKRLYLVRHGETLFNIQGKIQGWSDSPLTQRGIKQAQAVRDYFESEGISFDHAYSSTSERASDTLELITGMPYARLKGLKEVNYGFFEGEREMLKPKEPQEIVSFFVPFGGENTNDVAERVAKTLTEVMEQEDHTERFGGFAQWRLLQLFEALARPGGGVGERIPEREHLRLRIQREGIPIGGSRQAGFIAQ